MQELSTSGQIEGDDKKMQTVWRTEDDKRGVIDVHI